MSFKATVVALASTALIGVLPMAASAQDMGGHEIKAFEDLEFAPVEEGSPLEISVLWGDLETGPVGFLLRMPPGHMNPMHSHSSDYRAIILDGQMLHWIEGEDPDSVAPVGEGSYWYQPADQVHGDGNPSEEPALGLVIFDGPVDFIPAE